MSILDLGLKNCQKQFVLGSWSCAQQGVQTEPVVRAKHVHTADGQTHSQLQLEEDYMTAAVYGSSRPKQ